MNDLADLLRESGGISREGGGFVQGIVTDNADKKHAGMLKVEFTAWKQGGNIHEWMPVLRPYAGPGYGFYWIPEVGDIVLVGFMGAGFCGPFVLGSFSPSSAAVNDESFEKKNAVKRMRTKGKIDLSLRDEEGKQTVLLTTPAGLQAQMKDETKELSLSDKEGKNKLTLDCDNGKATLQAEKSITIECGGCRVELNADSGITISADKLTVSAKQTCKIKSGQSLTLEGAMLKAEGKQTADLKGGAMTKIEGGMVKIN